MRTMQGAEYEPQLPKEIEQKFIVDPALQVEQWLPTADRISQIYLSQPGEDWSLRVRSYESPDGNANYEATLKSKPGTESRAIIRDEVNTPISAETFWFYGRQDLPRIDKLRATLGRGVTMDWLIAEGEDPVPFVLEIEAEAPEQTAFYQQWRHLLTDVSHDPRYNNERLAVATFDHELEPIEDINMSKIIEIRSDIIRLAERTDRPIIVGVKGRSGSGKSTLVANLQSGLEFAHDMPSAVLSTDDYHRGKRWLLDTHNVERWDNWDAPVVYNTAELAFELREYLARAEPILKRHFDFATEEPVIETEAHPMARIVFVEGLYPHAPELAGLIDFMIDIPTPIATCVGRRIMRDLKTRLNGSLGNAADILRYQLEVAEPTYQLQYSE